MRLLGSRRDTAPVYPDEQPPTREEWMAVHGPKVKAINPTCPKCHGYGWFEGQACPTRRNPTVLS